MNNKEEYKALFEHATEGIVVSNSKGEIVKINPSAEKLFRYNPDELIGKKIEVLIPSKFSKRHEKIRENYLEKPAPRAMGSGMDLYALRKDGSEFLVEISLSTFDTEEGRFAIAFIVDITVRKQQTDTLNETLNDLQMLSEKLTNTNSELEKRVEDRTLMLREAIFELENNKIEISAALEKEKELNDLKSRFVSMASHEFRTPLSTILSSVALISKYNDLGTEEKRKKHIDRIKSSVTHLTEILNDLLSLSKLEEGVLKANPSPFNIEEFSSEIVRDMQALSKEGQTIIYKHVGEEKDVNLDVKFLKNIYINLLSNAIKFSSESNKIIVSTEILNSMFTLIVKDEGIGISKADQNKLFERFFRGENVTNIEGTGLGLNIVTKYIELMNGSINFESKINEGTMFTITLPI